MPESLLMILGIVLIMLGMFIIVFWGISRSVEKSSNENKEKTIKAGGVIMIGPIPIVFGSDKRSALIMIILAIVMILLAIAFIRLN